MLKRLVIALVGFLLLSTQAFAQSGGQPGISQKVAVCGYAFANRCIAVNADGSINTVGSGGGGGAVTIADGADVTLGAKADTAAGTGSVTAIAILKQLHLDVTGSIPAGTALIGKVGIDQTTPGTTNAITVGPTATAGAGIAATASTSAESCHVFKASPGNLYGASGYIGATGWLMVFDATAAPADGAVTPKAWAYAGAAGSWSINYGIIPAAMATGITVCASSTGPLTKTAYSTNTVFSGRFQ